MRVAHNSFQLCFTFYFHFVSCSWLVGSCLHLVYSLFLCLNLDFQVHVLMEFENGRTKELQGRFKGLLYTQ
jgi:hypothetical protein